MRIFFLTIMDMFSISSILFFLYLIACQKSMALSRTEAKSVSIATVIMMLPVVVSILWAIVRFSKFGWVRAISKMVRKSDGTFYQFRIFLVQIFLIGLIVSVVSLFRILIKAHNI